MPAHFSSIISRLGFKNHSKNKDSEVSKPNTINEFFPYLDLNSSQGEIRLITIDPASNPNEPITGRFIHAALSDRPPYEALSYTWGSFEDPVMITVDALPFYITQGLHAALCHLRLPSAARLMWIDAICINQLYIPERNAQVRIMREVYQKARKTLIWIGPSFKNSDALMDFMTEEEELQHTPGLTEDAANWVAANICRKMKDPDTMLVWKALQELCEQVYWTRMWIVQEAAFGGDPQVCVGARSSSFWDGLIRVLSSLDAELELEDPGAANWINFPWTSLLTRNQALAIGRLRKDLDTPKDAIWLLNSLVRFRSSNATEPRDKVFALLGFLDEKQSPYQKFFSIDYAASVRDIYLDVFKYCTSEDRQVQTGSNSHGTGNTTMTMSFGVTADGRIIDDWGSDDQGDEPYSRAHGSLNILTAAGLKQRLSDSSPSWLPHWGKDLGRFSIDELSGNRFTVSKKLEASIKFLRDRTVLRVTGISVDWVEHLGSTIQADSDLVDLVQIVASWLFLARMRPTETNPWNEQSFWRTLVFESYINRNFFTEPEEWQNMNLGTLKNAAENSINPGSQTVDLSTLANEMLLMLQQTTRGRRFALTANGAYMMLPEEAEVGDFLTIVFGCDLPLLLRPVNNGRQWLLIGECYCFGIMDGEVIKSVESAGLLKKTTRKFEVC